MFREIEAVRWVRVSTSRGSSSENAGSSRTSSNVIPGYAMRSCMGGNASEPTPRSCRLSGGCLGAFPIILERPVSQSTTPTVGRRPDPAAPRRNDLLSLSCRRAGGSAFNDFSGGGGWTTPSDASRDHGAASAWLLVANPLLKLFAEVEVPASGDLHEGSPDSTGQAIADQQVPEPVRSLVQVGHGEIGRDRSPILGPSSPDRGVGEEPSVAPGVSFGQLLGSQVLGAENDVRRVVLAPVPVQESAFGLHLVEKGRPWIRSEDVERGDIRAGSPRPIVRSIRRRPRGRGRTPARSCRSPGCRCDGKARPDGRSRPFEGSFYPNRRCCRSARTRTR